MSGVSGVGPAARPRALRPEGAVDLAVVAVLVLVATAGFGPSWGGVAGYLPPVLGGLVLGLAVAWVAAWRRVGVLGTALATAVGYLVLGGALALPGTAVAGVLPTAETIRGLVLGAVTSWKDVLTVQPPLDTYPELRVLPFLLTLTVTVTAASIALRSRRPLWALLPTGLLLVAVIALGTNEAAWPVLQGVTTLVVGLGWASWRTSEARAAAVDVEEAGTGRRLTARQVRGGAAMLGAAVVVVGLAAPGLAAPDHREVLRDVVVPPLDLHDYPTPLAAFRSYLRDRADEDLLTVDGLPAGERVRLAALDAYTGTVMDVAGGSAAGGSGAFVRVGSELPLTEGAQDAAAGRTVELRVRIAGYSGVWVPGAGAATSVRFTGDRADELAPTLHANPDAATVLTTAGLAEGDTYDLTTTLPPDVDPGELEGVAFADVRLPDPAGVPDSVSATADAYVGQETDPVTQVRLLRDGLVASGMLSHGLEGQPSSRPGHGSGRIDELLTDDRMVGDDEQFAVALTLMARALGIPARVVLGFYPTEDVPADGAPYTVHGEDVHAWVEVAFREHGWVPFDVLPDEQVPPVDQDPRSQSEPQPQQLEQPPPPEEPAVAPAPPAPRDADDDERADEGIDWGRYAAIVAAVVLPLAVLLAPFVLVVLLKARRRERRRTAADPVDRVSGGWRELTDRAVDLRVPLPTSATRRETGEALGRLADGDGPVRLADAAGPVRLAHRADAAVFGPGQPDDEAVDAYWRDVDEVVADLTATAGPWARLRARVSLASLRRARGSGPTAGGRG